jgi:TPR repeat protein
MAGKGNVMRTAIAIVAACAALALTACGKPKGNLDAGIAAYEKKDYAAAEKEIRPLAEYGNPQAQYYMAELAKQRQTVGEVAFRLRDAEVVEWYRKAAEQGHLQSQLDLGYIYGRGLGARENPAEALNWFRRAADQGSALGLAVLGNHYASGPQSDLVASYALFKASAEKDSSTHINASGRLAKLSERMSPEQLDAGQILARRLMAPGAVVSKVLKSR